MDKFDESIQQAKAEIQPSADFTDRVMHEVTAASQPKPHASVWRKLMVPVTGLAVLAILAVGAFSLGGNNKAAAPSKTAANQTVATTNDTTSQTDDFSSTINSIDSELAVDNTSNNVDASQLDDLSQ